MWTIGTKTDEGSWYLEFDMILADTNPIEETFRGGTLYDLQTLSRQGTVKFNNGTVIERTIPQLIIMSEHLSTEMVLPIRPGVPKGHK
jgi:hypothetical protein